MDFKEKNHNRYVIRLVKKFSYRFIPVGSTFQLRYHQSQPLSPTNGTLISRDWVHARNEPRRDCVSRYTNLVCDSTTHPNIGCQGRFPPFQ